MAAIVDDIKTLFIPPPKRLAEAVKEEGNKIKGPPGSLDVYTLPMKSHDMDVKGCKCFIFGKDSGKKNRTIIVLGATGAGKSTLVNRMINYILGVTWDDTFTFKLVDEDTTKSQAHSQTSEVTVYKLNHRAGFKIDHSLTIVDTPGFGDTRGGESDGAVIIMLEDLFSAKSGVSTVDAICFVVQASSVRLTKNQKYLFDSVINIFSKDVAENIQILVTFSDGTKPAVLEAIKEARVPCPKSKSGLPIHFKFNNHEKMMPGANNEDDDENEGDDMDEQFWNRGTKNMLLFFSALNDMKTKNLTLTMKVLQERNQMTLAITAIPPMLKTFLNNQGNIDQKCKDLEENKALMEKNEHHEVYFHEARPVKVKDKDKSLICKQCNVTCHRKCRTSFGACYFCEVFTGHGRNKRCTRCVGNCPVSAHGREKFYWGSEMVRKKQTLHALKAIYEMASNKAMSIEDIIKELKQESNCLENKMLRKMEEATQFQISLKEVALNPVHLTVSDSIDVLIAEENSEAKPFYLDRIKKLQDLREKAIMMVMVASGAGQCSG